MKPTLQEVQALFPEATEKRGTVWLRDMDVGRLLDGIPLSFTRRRYPGTTYTWVKAFITGQWVDLGDPWPCVTPSKKSLRIEIARRQTPPVYAS